MSQYTTEPTWEEAFGSLCPSPEEVEAERAYLAHLDHMEDYADYLAARAEEEAAEREAEEAEAEEAARLQAIREERAHQEGFLYEFFLIPGQVGSHYCQSTTGRIYRVGPDSCSCPDFVNTCQPLGIACKHLLARREWAGACSLPASGPVVVGFTTDGGRITMEPTAKAAA